MLKTLMEDYDSFIVTEKTLYKATTEEQKMYYLHQILFEFSLIHLKV